LRRSYKVREGILKTVDAVGTWYWPERTAATASYICASVAARWGFLRRVIGGEKWKILSSDLISWVRCTHVRDVPCLSYSRDTYTICHSDPSYWNWLLFPPICQPRMNASFAAYNFPADQDLDLQQGNPTVQRPGTVRLPII